MKPVGTAVAVIDLDSNKMEQGLKRVYDTLINGTIKTEDMFKQLGIKSDSVYTTMAANAALSYLKITESAKASEADKLRALAAYTEKVKALYNEQNSFEIAARNKAQQESSDYWAKRLAFEKQALKESEQANADYWVKKMAFESNAVQKAQQESADYWIKKTAFEKNALKESEQISADYWIKKIAFDKQSQAKIQQDSADYWIKRIAFEKQEVQQSEQITSDYWVKRIAFEKQAMQKSQQETADYWLKRMAFEKQATKESEQVTSDYWMRRMAYEKAAMNKAQQQSSDYWMARMAFEKKGVQQLSQESEAMWKTMGIRPTSAIEADKAAVLSSYATLTAAAKGNQQELINLERAKNDQLKKLNAEMVGEHEMSMASMTRAILRLYAAYYVLSTAGQYIVAPFEKGFQAVETYKMSVASMAAMVVTFTEKQKDMTDAQQWKQAVDYAKSIIPVLEIIAAKTALSGEETIRLANAFARQGVFLQANNDAQVEGFKRISNALPIMTKGQEIMRQIDTEIRSVMTGTSVANSQLLLALREIDPKIREHLEIWRKQGTVIQHIGDLLKGFGPAGDLFEQTWQAVKTTADTFVTQILRGGMATAYQKIIEMTQDLNKDMQDNKDKLIDWLSVSIGKTMLLLMNVKVEFIRVGALLDEIGKKFADVFEKNAGLKTGLAGAAYGAIAGVPAGPIGMGIGAVVGAGVGSYLGNKAHDVLPSSAEFEKLAKEKDEALKELALSYNKLEYSISAAGLAEAKAARDSTEAANTVFKARSAANGATRASAKDHSDMLKTMNEDNKHYYEGAINLAKEAAKQSQQQGQNELVTIQTLLDAQENALLERKSREEEIARFEVQSAAAANAAKNANAKPGTEKTSYDEQGILAAKLHSIELSFITDLNKAEQEAQIKREDYAKKNLEVTAQLYHTIDQYSEDSLNTEIAALKVKYTESQRWADADDVGKRLLLDAFYANELKLRRDNEQAKYNIALNYLEVTEGEYSKTSRAIYELSLKNQAAELASKMKSSMVYFDQEKWVAEQLFKYENQNERKIYDMKLSYLKDMGKEYTKEYRDIAILRIKNEADALEREFQKAAGGTGMTKEQQGQITAEQDLTQKLMQEWEDRLRAYSDFLKGMGDKEGSNTALKAAEEMANKRIELQDKVTKNAIAGQQTMFDKAAWVARKTAELDSSTFAGKMALVGKSIDSMGQAFSAVQSMYKEGSDEFNKWGEASKAMATAGKALALINAVATIAYQGVGGDVYTALPRIAAVAAAMGALLANIGGSVGGGGSGGYVAPTMQGSSGVLGAETGVGSESIANSIELLQDTYDMEDKRLTDLYNEMVDLNNNITAVVTSIARTGGLTNVKIPGPTLSTGQEFGNQWADVLKYTFSAMWDFASAGIGEYVAKFVGELLGGETKTTLKWVGIEFAQMTMGSILNAAQISARQFATLHTETSGPFWGGGGDEVFTKYADLDPQVMNTLTKVFKNMSNSLVFMAEGLGVDVQKVLDYTFQLTQIDLKNMNSEQISKALNEKFSSMFDTAVDTLFGGLIRKYQELNEGLAETAIRLINDMSVVGNVLEMTNQSFHTVDPAQMIAFSEAMIRYAGGLKALAEAASTYYDEFFSDAEKEQRIKETLADSLKGILPASNVLGQGGGGIMDDLTTSLFEGAYTVIPKTREEFRALVESLDLSTESGQQAYAALMRLSPLADQYYDNLEKGAKAAAEAAIRLRNEQEALGKSVNDRYNSYMGISANPIDEANKFFDEAYAAAEKLKASEIQLAQIRQMQSDVIDKLKKDEAKLLADRRAALGADITSKANSWLGITQSPIDAANEYFNKAYSDAAAMKDANGVLSTSEDELRAIRKLQSDVIDKLTKDEAKLLADRRAALGADIMSNYNTWMGIEESPIDKANKYFNQQYAAAELIATEDELKEIRKLQSDVIQKLTKDEAKLLAEKQKADREYWQGAVDYYVGMMGVVSPLQNQIDDVIKKFDEYREAAKGLSNETEALMIIQQAQSDVISKIIADWAKSLVQPLMDLGITMYEWGQATIGMTKDQIALSTLMLYRSRQGLSARGQSDVLNFNGWDILKDSDKIEAYVAQLAKYGSSIISAFEATYEAMQKIKETIGSQIAEITIGGLTTEGQLAYYGDQVSKGFLGLKDIAAEFLPDAIESVRGNLTKYYELEKQLIKEKYDVSTELINKKHADEIANIQAVRDKLMSFRYSDANIALPTEKAIAGASDYQRLFAAAQTGDADAVSKYLSFTDTALALAKEAYKSSDQYQAIYAQIMKDIGSLDTQPLVSMEDLTKDQNVLIESQTAAMTAELKQLDVDMVNALNKLSDQVNQPMAGVVGNLDNIINTIKILVDAGYGFSAAQPGESIGRSLQASAMTTAEMDAFQRSQNPFTFAADGYYTQSELTTMGFTLLYNQGLQYHTSNTEWQNKLYEGLSLWAAADMSNYAENRALMIDWAVKQLDFLFNLSNGPGFADGGITSGPSSGYLSKMHGVEAHIPLKNGMIPVNVKGTKQADGYDSKEVVKLLSTLVVQGSKKQQVTLSIDGRTFTGYIESVADRLDDNRQSKGVTRRLYR